MVKIIFKLHKPKQIDELKCNIQEDIKLKIPEPQEAQSYWQKWKKK